MGAFIDLTGQRFGRWTVAERWQNDKQNHAMWRCVCSCGNERLVAAYNLRAGISKSCGCAQAETVREIHTIHGWRYSSLYGRWETIKSRCHNPRSTRFKYYGARGIKVCDEWQKFPPFKEWALANGYRNNLTIERIDVNGNYEPSNCTWIPQSEQGINTRRTFKVLLNGKFYSFYGACNELSISYGTAQTHRYRKGISAQETLLHYAPWADVQEVANV